MESFVDLSYRGLVLGKRVRLAQVRPASGYLELALPMPVGTRIVLAPDEQLAFEATVTGVHEQIGGSDRTPGMIVTPALGEAAAAAWWRARVVLPDLPAPAGAAAATEAVAERAPAPDEPPGRARRVTVRPRSSTIPEPIAAADPELAATTLPMPAARDDGGDGDDATAAPEPADDGPPTTMMASVDLKALGLETGTSGPLPTVAEVAAMRRDDAGAADAAEPAAADDDAPDAAEDSASGPITNGAPPRAAGKRKKRR